MDSYRNPWAAAASTAHSEHNEGSAVTGRWWSSPRNVISSPARLYLRPVRKHTLPAGEDAACVMDHEAGMSMEPSPLPLVSLPAGEDAACVMD